MARTIDRRTQYTYIEWSGLTIVFFGFILMLLGVVMLIADALGYLSR